MKFICARVALLLSVSAPVIAQTNTATVSQTGNAQSATAVQTGSANQSTINQLTGTATTPNTGNRAFTTQSGTSPTVPGNLAFVRQINGSDYNEARIGQQQGTGNTATIEQQGSAANRTGGTALRGNVAASPSTTDAGNYASISQTGTGNNQTLIRQNAGALGGSQANYGVIRQVGDNNGVTFINQSKSIAGEPGYH